MKSDKVLNIGTAVNFGEKEKGEKMKHKLKILFTALTIALMLSAFWVSMTPATSSPKRVLFRYAYEEYFPDDYTAETPNFADYPADFSDGTWAWDLDIIDIEKTVYDGEGIYVAVLDTGLWRIGRIISPRKELLQSTA